MKQTEVCASGRKGWGLVKSRCSTLKLRDEFGCFRRRKQPWNESVYHLYVVRSPQRDQLRARLSGAGIGSGVYYPLPLHLQEVYRGLGYRAGDLPEAERASRETLALPLDPEISEDTVRLVVKTLLGN
jgi:dTDP-4-amino-4,6-dideoxygalactose transaminase